MPGQLTLAVLVHGWQAEKTSSTQNKRLRISLMLLSALISSSSWLQCCSLKAWQSLIRQGSQRAPLRAPHDPSAKPSQAPSQAQQSSHHGTRSLPESPRLSLPYFIPGTQALGTNRTCRTELIQFVSSVNHCGPHTKEACVQYCRRDPDTEQSHLGLLGGQRRQRGFFKICF